jgi:rhomboid protease GluP
MTSPEQNAASAVPIDDPNVQQAPPRERRPTIFSVFDPRRKHLITAIIIGLNTLVFLAMVFSGANIFEPKTETLFKWGAVFRPAVLGGEWWRLITCCFVHVGLFHLMVNMYALLYIGIMIEPLLGRLKFLVAYLLTGLLASVSSVVFNSYTVGAGASGAIFGVYGLFLALLTTKLIHPQVRKPLLKSMVWFVVLNLAIGFSGFVDNAAHAGGLVSGFLFGYAYLPALTHPWRRGLSRLTVLLSIAGALALTVTALRLLPNDTLVYEQKLQTFESRDSLARSAYDQMINAGPAQRGDWKNKATAYWQQCLNLATEMDLLHLPQALSKRNFKLKAYCMLRLQQTVQTYLSLNGETGPPGLPYKNQLRTLESQLDSLEKSLGDDE